MSSLGNSEGSVAYKKGESGNPAGRPIKGNTMKDALLEALNAENRRVIGTSVVALAKSGNMEAIKFVYDRIDGKVKDIFDVNQGGAIRVSVEYRDSGPIDPAEAAPGPEDDQEPS